MQLGWIDWSIVGAAFAAYLAIGLWAGSSASSDCEGYFLGGRAQPWWLLGISMVATTFATDTPNLVTGIVREHGVAGNWLWWAFLLTGSVTTFLFAKLWNRSGMLTDIEFYELRYSGRPATFLRGFRAVYLGVFFNVFIMANVTLAAIKIGGVLLGLDPVVSVTVAAGVTLVYSAVGGLTGVLLTDLVQFAVAMVGSVGAAIYVLGLPEVGGLGALMARPEVAAVRPILPDPAAMSRDAFLALCVLPLAVQWWSSYYPGAEPGGGGYVVQRILAARDERHATGATLLFNVMHYAVRPWPWILVAFASLAVFPTVESLRLAYPDLDPRYVHHDLAYPAMLSRLPPGLLGLVAASLIAAYMSTMSTQVNWGSSIIVNDIYRRFIEPDASQRRLVWVGRLATVGLMSAACCLALVLRDALSSFQILLQIGAGTGMLLMLRWFWWRINAAAEIAAMVVSFAVAAFFFVRAARDPAAVPPEWQQLLWGVGLTTAASLLVTLLTPPTDRATLEAFWRKIRPAGPGWRRITAGLGAGPETSPAGGSLPWAVVAAICSTVGTWALTLGGGWLMYGDTAAATIAALVAAVCAAVVWASWSRLGFE